MENKTNTIPEEKLENVTGGAIVPTGRYSMHDHVRDTDGNCGRILRYRYDASLGTWVYQVEYGAYHGGQWVRSSRSLGYIPGDQLTPVDRSELEL